MAQVEAQLKMVSLMWTYRKIRGLTIKQASEMIGLKSPAQYSKWERGLVKPDYDSIRKILWVLNATYEQVFGSHQQDLLKQNMV
jgi:transcriptional regulator with XRE-family HTH domain